MTIAIICQHKDPAPWVAALQSLAPSLDVQVYPNEADKQSVEFALCWQHPPGALRAYPNLRCVCSMGAGVDHLLNDPQFPSHLPVLRLVDPGLAQAMFEYIAAVGMYFFRDLDIYRQQQRQSCWQALAPKPIAATTMGIMGLGALGAYVARKLVDLGFSVVGWSRSAKSLASIPSYVGRRGLRAFAEQVNILVCLLPLTPQTRGILNSDLFNMLPRGACLVNVARGEHLVEQDLLNALQRGQLRAAYLDVFNQEPLAASHPFWQHRHINVTPHCSSVTNPHSVAPQIVQNYQLMRSGQPLKNRIDISRGY